MSSTKRIMNELIKIEKHNIENTDGIYIYAHDNDIHQFQALIVGPKDSVFHGGFFIFDIVLSQQYPFIPPSVKFVSPKLSDVKRIHPNLYQCGKVCLNVINTWGEPNWSPTLNLISICYTIQSILDMNPLLHEPGFSGGGLKQMHKEYSLASDFSCINMVEKIYENREVLHPLIKEKIELEYQKNKDIYDKRRERFKDVDMVVNNIHYKNFRIKL